MSEAVAEKQPDVAPPLPVVDPAPVAKEEPAVVKETVSPSPKDVPVVPEKYDLKLSEGSPLDVKDLDELAAIARSQGLSQEKASAFVADHEKRVVARVDRQAKAWLEQAQNDKEIGGNAFRENVELAVNVVKKFGSPALLSEMNKLGYGNHPEWIRLFAKIGKQFSNDKAVMPGAAAPVTPTRPLEERLYPTMFEKKE